ncbi:MULTISPECIES: hypothetical protein [unclassified Kribbella]|uniref:hypothetical protein n=1 Tax=unclassified Kribbella TaxID=2644121 RepID=UPI003019EC9F
MTTTKQYGYWLAGAIALAGLVLGVTLGFTSFRDAQRRLDSFDGTSIPGTMSLRIDQPTSRVVYYEGGDRTVRYDDLSITVTDPVGSPVDVTPYQGELVYEKVDLTEGRAVATFDAPSAGVYEIQVSGVSTGRLVVGDSYAHRALPGVLAGLAIAILSLVAGFILWLSAFTHRAVSTTT